MLIIICILSLLHSSLSTRHVTSSNYSSLVQNPNLTAFLFSNDLPDAQYQISMLQSKLKLTNSSIPIYVGQLGNNKQAQRNLNIKRYPYFTLSIPFQGHNILYGMPDIVTINSMYELILKVQSYLFMNSNSCQFCSIKIKVDEKKLESQGISSQDIANEYYFNPLFYNVYFIRQKLAGKNNVQVSDFSGSTSYKLQTNHELGSLLNSIVLGSIPQFSESIFSLYQKVQGKSHMFLLILDSFNFQERVKSEALKRQLQASLNRYGGRGVYIFWMESKFNIQKQKYLGFSETDKPPLFAYFDPFQGKKSKIPANSPINHHTVKSFIESFFEDEKKQNRYEELRPKLQKRGIRTEVKEQNYLIYLSQVMDEEGIQLAEFIVKRMKKFMFDETIHVAMPQSYTFNHNLIENGLILRYKGKEVLLSTQMKGCIQLEAQISDFVKPYGLPPNWCVPEEQMHEFLLKDEIDQ